MSLCFRIHGDNIVECERVAKIIIGELQRRYRVHIWSFLASPGVIAYQIRCNRWNYLYLLLLPGFSSRKAQRWGGDIFNALIARGDILNEKPDVILTRVAGRVETILLAIEFCGALQAGNQAWQRSGRAFSVGRAGCPYAYVVDFAKYELDSATRERKGLRFPNPSVPYSYISFSRAIGNFVAPVYVESEEFDRNDPALSHFDEANFASQDLASWIVGRMFNEDVTCIEDRMLQKAFNVVKFLAEKTENPLFSPQQWNDIYQNQRDFADYVIKKWPFSFKKVIADKSKHGHVEQVAALIEQFACGVAERFPFGIVPAASRQKFAAGLAAIYPDIEMIARLGQGERNLFVCIFKGFKPGGDDDRPDRGLAPLCRMLSADCDILTFIYGPILQEKFNLLCSNPLELANSNGLWKAVLQIGDAVIVDSPIVNSENFAEYGTLTERLPLIPAASRLPSQPAFAPRVRWYGEDDVDTAIHFLFTHELGAFEGLCNPPGGDWSGLSVMLNTTEFRWLSLPREGRGVDGKRPDHVVELFEIGDRPVLLVIESKESAHKLESGVGLGLVNYMQHLMDFPASVERPAGGKWTRCQREIDPSSFVMVSAGAYLKHADEDPNEIFAKSGCELLLGLRPHRGGWELEIGANTENAHLVKEYIARHLSPLSKIYLTN